MRFLCWQDKSMQLLDNHRMCTVNMPVEWLLASHDPNKCKQFRMASSSRLGLLDADRPLPRVSTKLLNFSCWYIFIRQPEIALTISFQDRAILFVKMATREQFQAEEWSNVFRFIWNSLFVKRHVLISIISARQVLLRNHNDSNLPKPIEEPKCKGSHFPSYLC